MCIRDRTQAHLRLAVLAQRIAQLVQRFALRLLDGHVDKAAETCLLYTSDAADDNVRV
ncbi:hypothetical protein [Dyella sp. ASV21]|uniref:hypothetical protein n=1 Tax=Dyella sp. ASV21 TaxID=2795114 RepID=UPI0018EC1A74|nr:hypothetical protein [Dyella sp. ASV21]